MKTRVEAATPADGRLASSIESELKAYDRGFDLEALPDDQRAKLGAIANNLPQAAGGVETLRVTHGVVEADTDFPDDDEGRITARLICGAIERSVPKDDRGGHRVLGADDANLLDCQPDDANYP